MSARAVLPLMMLVSFAAVADRPSARLAYVRLPGAESCPGLTDARSAVVTRLGYDPFRDEAGDLIEVFVERQARGLRARLQLKNAAGVVRGRRELSSHAGDCSELSNALALAIAIAVDPQAFLALPPGPATPSTPAISPATPTPTGAAEELQLSAPPPPPPLEPETRPHVTAAVGALGLLGTTPGLLTGGLTVRFGVVAGERFSVNLDGRAELPNSMNLLPGTVSVTNLSALLAPCVHLKVFAACAVVGAGVTRISSQGLGDARELTAPFFQVGGRVQVLVPVTRRLAFGGSLDLLAPVARPVLLVDQQPVWSAPPVNGSAGLFVAFAFL